MDRRAKVNTLGISIDLKSGEPQQHLTVLESCVYDNAEKLEQIYREPNHDPTDCRIMRLSRFQKYIESVGEK